jgi:cytochrome b
LIHRISGEAIAGLLVFRLIWGFAGGEHARFADFAAAPSAIATHIGELFSGKAKRHLGHNPLGGLAVFLLLLTTAAIVVTGLFSGEERLAGPFAGVGGVDLSEIHEVLFRLLQGLVVIHILGVITETLLAKDALVPAMITGAKKRRAEEAASDARTAPRAAFLAAAALGVATSTVLISLPTPQLAAHDHDHGGEIEDGDD